jgi:hypothetical protein
MPGSVSSCSSVAEFRCTFWAGTGTPVSAGPAKPAWAPRSGTMRRPLEAGDRMMVKAIAWRAHTLGWAEVGDDGCRHRASPRGESSRGAQQPAGPPPGPTAICSDGRFELARLALAHPGSCRSPTLRVGTLQKQRRCSPGRRSAGAMGGDPAGGRAEAPVGPRRAKRPGAVLSGVERGPPSRPGYARPLGGFAETPRETRQAPRFCSATDPDGEDGDDE